MLRLLLLFAIVGGATIAQAQYVLDVRAPVNTAQAVYANSMRQSNVMNNLVMLINKHIRVDREVPIIARSCGTANAFYNPNTREISLCYELMVESQLKRQREGINGGALSQSVWAETALVLLHEVGHHLIHEYTLPVLGKEEDAADKIAAYILLASDGDVVLKFGARFFETPERGFFSLSTGGTPDYSGVHGLPQQRHANLICWGMGKNPAMFSDQVERAKLSRDRLQRCNQEYTLMKRDLTALLGSRLVTAGPPDVNLQRLGSLAEANQCLACHKPSEKAVGPSFSEIAKRYEPNAVREVLQRKVSSGSQGIWGVVPAPAMPNIGVSTVDELSQWISAFR